MKTPDKIYNEMIQNCPYNFRYVINRLRNVYENFEDFINDYEGSLNFENYIDNDWIELGDWLDECNMPEFDYSLIY